MDQRWIWPFELLEKIGRGGMGEVYKARYVKNDKLFAVKLVSLDVDNPTVLARFEREMALLKTLKHPNIVRCFGGLCDNKQRFYAMELVEGGTLRRLLRTQGPLRWEQAVEFTVQICAGLGHAHERGIIHRDVKPGNFLMTDHQHLKLADFGLATLAAAEKLTSEGRTQGTFQYMAPEQIRGKPAPVPQTDLYAVGCVLFEMLTGRVPFEAETPAECLHKHLKEAPPHIYDYVEGCPIELDQLIQDLLAKEIERRPNSAKDVIRQLRNINPLITVIDTKGSSQEKTPTPVKSSMLPPEYQAPPVVKRETVLWPIWASLIMVFIAGIWSWRTTDFKLTVRQSEETWVAALRHSNDTIRIFAAQSLGTIEIGSDRVLSALSDGLNDPNVEVRKACADGLAHQGSAARKILPVLRKVQQTDNSPLVRERAEQAIEAIREVEASSSMWFWSTTTAIVLLVGFAGYQGVHKLL